jgi:hypothetical protein
MCTVLCNVVALNVFYNIGVKFYSSLLLISVLLLLIPYAGRLFEFFFYNRNVSLAGKEFVFRTPWKRYVLTGVFIIMVGGTMVMNFILDVSAYRRNITRRKKQKLYDVAWFKSKDTLPPLLSDTLRWKRFALFHKNSAAVYSMKDSASIYDYDTDTSKHSYTLHDNPDSTKWDKLYYDFPQKNRLVLTGKWKGIDVQMLMDEVPIDSMVLSKDKIKFLQD